MQFKMIHNNINVTDMERSIKFYEQALGLTIIKRKQRDNFELVFMGNDLSTHQLELTCLADHPQPYDLGENEFHLAFRVDDYEAAHALHASMNCICYENTAMGLYFINDPDGYWLEILPTR
jgi:lactoylglutathione lyase